MARQLQLPLPAPGETFRWGGRRRGAGRKRRKPPEVAHVARPAHKERHPTHVTVRVRPHVPNLRSWKPHRAVHGAIRGTQRADFRVVAFSTQRDHIHLIVEAANAQALSRGMNALNCRLVRRLHIETCARGRLLQGRYHARDLRTAREVRNAYAYVLLNYRKHAPLLPKTVDPYSSGPWFRGWASPPPERQRGHVGILGDQPPTALPETWLAAVGWKRWGPIRWAEKLPDGHEPPS